MVILVQKIREKAIRKPREAVHTSRGGKIQTLQGSVEGVYHMTRAFSHCSVLTPARSKWEAWHFNGARGEAKCLIRLLDKNGNTPDPIRELIRVAPEEEAALRAFALQCSELAGQIERALRYRIRVEEEFESLVSRNTR